MPVTARLSRKFYEKFGDELTNELVEWFNQVDTAYRAEFRNLFEVHFGRFDAKLDERTGGLNAKLEQRIAELSAKVDRQIGELSAKLDQGLAEFRVELARGETRLIRWMFLFWAGTLGTLIALQHLSHP
jgi:hypothetical protein